MGDSLYTPRSNEYWAEYYKTNSNPINLVLPDWVYKYQRPVSSTTTRRTGPRGNNAYLKTVKSNTKWSAGYSVVAKALQGDSDAMAEVRAKKLNELSPELQSLYKQVATLEQQTGASQSPSVVERVIDVLSRPTYAVASAYKAQVQSLQNASGSTDINDFLMLPFFTPGIIAANIDDFWNGLYGTSKVTFSDVLNQAHPDMPDVAKGVLGFALDVAMDPTTYIGVGAFKSLAKGAATSGIRAAGNADKLAKSVDEMAEAIVKSDDDTLKAVYRELDKAWEESGYPNVGGRPATEVPDALKLNPRDKDLVKQRLQTMLVGSSARLSPGSAGSAVQVQATRAAKEFLTAIQPLIYKNVAFKEYDRIIREAIDNGDFVPVGDVLPAPGIEMLSEKALSMGEAEAIARIQVLRSERGRLTRTAGLKEIDPKVPAKSDKYGYSSGYHMTKKEKDLRDARVAEINKELDSLLDTLKVDLKDPTTVEAINALLRYDDEALTLIRQRDALDSSLRTIKVKGKNIRVQQSFESVDDIDRFLARVYKTSPAKVNKNGTLRKQLIKDLEERKAVEAALNQKIADVLFSKVNALNLPKGARKVKYRKTPTGDLVRQLVKLVDDAHSERMLGEATQAAAMMGVEVPKTGRQVTKNADAVIKEIKEEIQYRLNDGSLTRYDLKKVAEKEGADPSVLDDFAYLEPKNRAALTLAENRPAVVAIPKVDPEDAKAILAKNETVSESAKQLARQRAAESADDITATALDIMVQEMNLATRRNFSLKIGFLGNGPAVASFAVPAWLDDAVERVYNFNWVKKFTEAFNKSLVSSAGLDPLLARAKAREMGKSNAHIAAVASRLREEFSQFSKAERIEAWKSLVTKGNRVPTAADEVIIRELRLIAEKFAPGAFRGIREPLSLGEVAAWLPSHTKLYKKGRWHDWSVKSGVLHSDEDPVEWLLEHLKSTDLLEIDPAELVWDLHIASEKAIQRKATIETIVQNFGISAGDDQLTQTLRNKYGYHEYEPIAGQNYIFSPEIARQVRKIDELLKSPKGLEFFGEYAGRITTLWKRTVTVYNPGFHVRNTAGDLFVSWLDGVSGVHGVKSFGMAVKTLKAFKRFDVNSKDVDELLTALNDPEMAQAYQRIKNLGTPPNQSEVLFRSSGGVDWTIGDIMVHYMDEGLISGYTNTEFASVFRAPGSVGSSAVGRKATEANRGVLHFSETREDLFRLHHFIDVIRKSKTQDMHMAAAEAGARVRKYHFDYGDFTPVEKLTLARVFPFYKWTRKAFPLMVEMLFTKPGKMLMYPKAMTGASVAAGMAPGEQGFVPRPDAITPEWLNARPLFPLFVNPSGESVYGGIALPSTDVFRNPYEMGIGMLHPGIKALIEVPTGERLGTGAPIDSNLQYLTSLFPQSNFAGKQIESVNAEQIAAFLSGVSISPNTERSMQGELINRRENALKLLKAMKEQGNA